MMRAFWKSTVPLLTALALAGCHSWHKHPEAKISEIYQGAAQRKDIHRQPVIVIPGILGSRLVDDTTGQVVWGAFSREAANPSDPDSARLFSIPMRPGVPLHKLDDSIRSDGALESLKVSLFPSVSIQPKAYLQILSILGAGGFRDETFAPSSYGIDYGKDHYNCFQFDYDWRRSSAENAVELGKFIRQKKAYVEAENFKRYGKRQDVKFNLVAHSMGSLIARYYLRYGEQGMPASGKPNLTWSGAKNVDKLVMVAPPNAGSALSIHQSVHGLDLGPFTFKYPPSLIGTMPASYELLPRARHRVLKDTVLDVDLDPLDPEVWISRQWGLADPGQSELLAAYLPDVVSAEERTEIAHDHLRKCLRNARHFQAALDIPSTPPRELRYILFAGDAIDTPVQVEAWPRRVKFVEFAAGDDTVARYSALMDDRFASRSTKPLFKSPIRWDQTTFLFESHLGITQSRTFADNLLFELLEKN